MYACEYGIYFYHSICHTIYVQTILTRVLKGLKYSEFRISKTIFETKKNNYLNSISSKRFEDFLEKVLKQIQK